jgi:hypothetical protein
LAIGELVVALTLAVGQEVLELLSLEAEPRCWRSFASVSGGQILRPDLFVALGVGEYERRWFIEIDRGQESMPVIIRKCRRYQAYYQSGAEQARHGVFPRICWVVPDEHRATGLDRAITSAQDLTKCMFAVCVMDASIEMLAGSAE